MQAGLNAEFWQGYWFYTYYDPDYLSTYKEAEELCKKVHPDAFLSTPFEQTQQNVMSEVMILSMSRYVTPDPDFDDSTVYPKSSWIGVGCCHGSSIHGNACATQPDASYQCYTSDCHCYYTVDNGKGALSDLGFSYFMKYEPDGLWKYGNTQDVSCVASTVHNFFDDGIIANGWFDEKCDSK